MGKANFRTLLLILLLLSSMSPLFADTQIIFGNDTWSMGLSENDDDLLTYSTTVTTDINPWLTATMDFQSFTDRGHRTEGRFQNGRFDYVSLFATAHRTLKDPSHGYLTVTGSGSLGLSYTGNLGGGLVQNILHMFMNIPAVNLPYLDVNMALPRLRLYGAMEFDAFEIGRLRTSLRISTGYDFVGPYDRLRIEISGRFEFNGAKGHLSLDLIDGGGFWTELSGMYADMSRGPGFGFGYDLGVLSFSYRVNLNSARGYGFVVINPTKVLKMDTTWERTGMYLRVSKAFMTGLVDYSSCDIGYVVNDYTAVCIKTMHSGGFPDKGKAVTETYRMRRNYGIWLAGVTFFRSFDFFEPHISISTGVSHWKIDKRMNMDPDSAEDSEVIADRFFPVMQIECGLTLLPEGFTCIGPSSLRADVFAGIIMVPRALEKVFEKDLMHGNWSMHTVIPYAGVGLVFGF